MSRPVGLLGCGCGASYPLLKGGVDTSETALNVEIKRTRMQAPKKEYIAIVGDIDTIEGLQIAGIVDDPLKSVFAQVTAEDTPDKISEALKAIAQRGDVGLVLVCDFASRKIPAEMHRRRGQYPCVFTIPSKNRL